MVWEERDGDFELRKDARSGDLTAIFYLMRVARHDRIKAVVRSVAGRYKVQA